MKHMWKKVVCTLLASVCVFSFTACGGTKEADVIPEDRQAMLISNTQGLSEMVVALTDEEIAAYAESGDPFTENVMDVWSNSQEELGEWVSFGEPTVEKDGIEYVVTLPGTFEKAEAAFVYIYDKQMTPTSLSVDVKYPMSVNLQRAGMNTLMGLGVVFAVLIFLSFVISLFKLIPNSEQKKKEAAKSAQAAPAPVAAAPAVQGTDDQELIAVIAAAIAAAEGTSPDGFVVRSIRKVNRRKW